MRRWHVVIILACTLILSCRGRESSDDTEGADTDNTAIQSVVSVGTAVATLHTFTPTIRAIGTVSPSPDGYAELSAPGPTRIAHVYVALGDLVNVGTPLVAFEGASLQATAQSTDAALTTAQAAYDRAVRLSKSGIVPHKTVDQAVADLAQANATNIAARRANELSTLRAPMQGVVTRVSAVQGAAADANSILVAVANPAKFDVVLSLVSNDAATIRRGAAVTLRTGETPDALTIGTGVVAGIGATLDSVTHAVPVRVTVRHVNRPLRMGETITSDIAALAIPRAVTVPPEAIVLHGDSVIVFVVDHGVAHAHAVTVGARTDSTAQILSGPDRGPNGRDGRRLRGTG